MRILQVVGEKKSGKTTLIVDCIRSAVQLNLNVAVLKRSHHCVSMDAKDSDSHRFVEAGSAQVGLQTSSAFLWQENRPAQALEDEIKQYVAPNTDLLLIEGFHSSCYPKIQLVKSEDESGNATIFKEVACPELLDLTNPIKRQEFLRNYWQNKFLIGD